MFKFNDSKSYKHFIHQRDEALEKIFRNHVLKTTDILNSFFTDILYLVQSKYPFMLNNHFNKNVVNHIEQTLMNDISRTVNLLAKMQKDLRRKSYALAFAGEDYAVSQIIGGGTKSKFGGMTHTHLHSQINRPSSSGVHIAQQYMSFFLKVKRDVLHAIEMSALFNDPLDKAMGRVYLTFPKLKAYPKAPALRRVKTTEADRGSGSGVNISLGKRPESFEYDPITWKEILDDYEKDYIPVNRSPDEFFDLRNPFSDLPITTDINEENKLYAWELEKEINHDFVQSVRSGQVEAANNNGIDDFVWIAVIDAKTCEQCCVWRHGLLTSEIEKKLADNDELASYCDAVVPPAHFNCRCSLAPASKDLEAEDTSAIDKEFDDWLNGTEAP